jgi:hypothetical protein
VQTALFLVERGRERAHTAERPTLRHERAEAERRLRAFPRRRVARRGGALEVEVINAEDGVRKDLAAEGGAYLSLL